VDSFRTELIADRIWRTRSQLELAVVKYLGRLNHSRLARELGDLSPAEFEAEAPRAQAAPRRAKDRPSTAGLWRSPVPSKIPMS
jgi:Integrase core domain